MNYDRLLNLSASCLVLFGSQLVESDIYSIQLELAKQCFLNSNKIALTGDN